MSLIVALCGGSASGKTQAVDYLKNSLSPEILHIPHDSYYKDMSHLSLEQRADYNFDHPECIENDLLLEDLQKLKNDEAIYIPSYSYLNSKRTYPSLPTFRKPIILIDGLFLFADKQLRDVFDYKIFIDAEEDIRVKRCVERDVKERGMTFEGVSEQIQRFKLPMHNKYVEPFKTFADSIIENHKNDIEKLESQCMDVANKVKRLTDGVFQKQPSKAFENISNYL